MGVVPGPRQPSDGDERPVGRFGAADERVQRDGWLGLWGQALRTHMVVPPRGRRGGVQAAFHEPQGRTGVVPGPVRG